MAMTRGMEVGSANALNAICPYFTMFPLSFPLRVLSRRKKGVVVDPFCGRGTTNLAARVHGMRTVAVDSAPTAVAAAAAKLPRGFVEDVDVIRLARRLCCSRREAELPEGAFWHLAYDPYVLEAVCRLREGLLHERSDAGRVLRALLMGALHGPMRKDGSSFYFSNQCPRTFSPKPDYAVRYWAERKMRPPRVDVLEIVQIRAMKALTGKLPPVRAHVVRADSRKVPWSKLLDGLGKIDWVVTSPPYYGLRTYRPDQWLREWFLGGTPEVVYQASEQVRHSSPEHFARDIGLVFKRLVPFCSKGARLVMRFGSINDRPIDAMGVVRAALRDSGWRIDTVHDAGSASAGRRQVKSFATTLQPARTEYDVWCSLA